MSATTRAAFVFPNPRAGLVADVEAGRAPDTALYGANHLGDHGIDVRVHDPLLTRRERPGPLHRVTWSLRELPLPWELRDVDVAVTPLANLFPLVARARRRPRVLLVDYGLNLIHRRGSPARRRLLRSSLRSAAGVLCLGRSQQEELVEWGLVDERRAHVVPLGVDADWFPPREPVQGEPLVLAVGKDLARDYATFADAMRGLDVRAEIIAFPRNLEGVALPPNVTARSVALAELRDLYACAGCVVVPQHPDGYAYGSDGGLTVLLEAMATARPVVATERAVLRDYVTDGKEALVVPPRDPSALREAIARALDAPELGTAGRARVEQAHTTRHLAERLAPLVRAAAVSTLGRG
jgi:glycosyltransferase involved in cell wall biosynthesis